MSESIKEGWGAFSSLLSIHYHYVKDGKTLCGLPAMKWIGYSPPDEICCKKCLKFLSHFRSSQKELKE